MTGQNADAKVVMGPLDTSFSGMNTLDDMLNQPDARQEPASKTSENRHELEHGEEKMDPLENMSDSSSSDSSVNSLVRDENRGPISDHSDSSVNTLDNQAALHSTEPDARPVSSSFDSSNSSRNTLDDPGLLDEKDREITELKKEIDELKNKQHNQLLTLIVEMNKLHQKYVEIEQSLCGVCYKQTNANIYCNKPLSHNKNNKPTGLMIIGHIWYQTISIRIVSCTRNIV